MLVRVLGPLEVEIDDEPVPLGGPKQRILLSALAAGLGRVVPADALIEAGWGDDLPSDPTNALQYQVARLRRLVEEDTSSPRYVVTRSPGYALDAALVDTDAARFAMRLEAARTAFAAGDLSGAMSELDAGLGLWRGSALVEHREIDLLRADAERLDAELVEARELQVDVALAQGRHGEWLPQLEQLTDEHPFHEGLWARRIVALYRSGRQTDALRVARAAREQLAELGLEPGPELRDVEQLVLTHDPSLAAPAAVTTAAHTLPAAPNRLIGRDDELARATQLLERSRQVTIVGPGGAGKTRLAIEVGRRALDQHPGGVWFVPLDAIHDPVSLAADVGRRTGMREDPDREIVDTLADHLDTGPTLLVLDNCEHVLDPVARLVDDLLSRCPRLTVLATSQARLGTTAETVLDLASLAVPGSSGSIYDPIEEVHAVALFVERAGDAGADVDRWGPDELAAVANIVVELDGMPLAVELAAARARSMSLQEIAHGLQERFDLLDSGPRTAPERQRSLHGALTWSLDLLDAGRRVALRQLSVFVDGFDIVDAAAVLDVAPNVARRTVAELMDRSLIQRSADVAGGARYRMLESLRQHGLAELATDLPSIRDLHLRHFAAVGSAALPGLRGPEQASWLARLDAGYENLRAALVRSVDGGDPALGVRLAAGLAHYWDWRGLLRDAVDWTGRLVAASDPGTPGRPRLMGWRAYLAWELGDLEVARALEDEAVAAGRALDDPVELSIILSSSVLVARSTGDLARAEAEAEEIRRLGISVGEPWHVAWAESALATIALAEERFDEAEELARASIAAYEGLGDEHAATWGRLSVAQVELGHGDLDAADAMARTALDASVRLDDDRSATWALELLAESADRRGESERAARLLGAAHPFRESRGLTASPSKRAAVDRLGVALGQRLGDAYGQILTQARTESAAVIDDELDVLRSEA